MMLKKYDPQLTFDFDAAEVNAALQAGIPKGATLGGPHEKSRHFHPALKPEEQLAHEKEQRKRKRANTIRANTRKKTKEVVAPMPPAERAAALIARMLDIEKRVHDEKTPVTSVHAEIREIMDDIAGLGALLAAHEFETTRSLNDTVFVRDEPEGTVGDMLFGAFEVYREILGHLASREAKNGREALDMHERDMHDFTAQVRARLKKATSGK